jgi:hypothetical protein
MPKLKMKLFLKNVINKCFGKVMSYQMVQKGVPIRPKIKQEGHYPFEASPLIYMKMKF